MGRIPRRGLRVLKLLGAVSGVLGLTALLVLSVLSLMSWWRSGSTRLIDLLSHLSGDHVDHLRVVLAGGTTTITGQVYWWVSVVSITVSILGVLGSSGVIRDWQAERAWRRRPFEDYLNIGHVHRLMDRLRCCQQLTTSLAACGQSWSHSRSRTARRLKMRQRLASRIGVS